MFRPTTTVTKIIDISAAHWLPDHPGKCKYLHGHNYKIEISVKSSQVDELTGILIDFADLKRAVAETIGFWDHALLTPYTSSEIETLLQDHDSVLRQFGIIDPTKVIPIGMPTTAENLAMSALTVLRLKFRELGFSDGLVFVKIWETDDSSAEVIGALA
jgi:6-pyruvoyltetrahydropterin/6-carboxytetrahydropterin synthase